MHLHWCWEWGEPKFGVQPDMGCSQTWGARAALQLRLATQPRSPPHPSAAQPLPWLRPCKSGRNASAAAASEPWGRGGPRCAGSPPALTRHIPTVTGCRPLQGPLRRARATTGERGLHGGCCSPTVWGMPRLFAGGWVPNNRSSRGAAPDAHHQGLWAALVLGSCPALPTAPVALGTLSVLL